jgi:hypothetical protein
LNGNIGILKSLVSEITDPTNLPQAYGYMPIAWVCAVLVSHEQSFTKHLFCSLLVVSLGAYLNQYAYTVVHRFWCFSPLIGGSLSRPAERFPGLFGESDFLKKYPYFLPCAVPATFTLVAWLVTFFFLEEVSSCFSISSTVFYSPLFRPFLPHILFHVFSNSARAKMIFLAKVHTHLSLLLMTI